MPIFEEKLICPLSVRFTQEHVRPVFQEKKLSLETTIKQIKTRPGIADYDVILEAPFPNIEVVRWYQDDENNVEPDAEHWFTLDNRRLYCLQKVAVSLWPRKVAIVVELLYSPTDGLRRKDDSSTVGRSVGIGHSLKALTDRWDWRQAIPTPAHSCPEHDLALQLVIADDFKAGVEHLVDAPALPGMIDLYFQKESEVNIDMPKLKLDNGSEDSTANPASPRSMDSLEGTSPAPASSTKSSTATARELLSGIWHGAKGETYEVEFKKKDAWTCMRMDSSGFSKKYSLWYDAQADSVWWGNDWGMYLYLAEARAHEGCLKWRDVNDPGNWKPRFIWQRSDTASGETVQACTDTETLRTPRYRAAKQPRQVPQRMWAPARSGQA
mmetsp:Transcript_36247/g.91243  ORF Transcript_36247/g.91243 Transcript_36247/m.91243 type:complete len:382 (+) Transcript_36247:71-1216(+)|eukprot:CAMPEP_0115224560 /NCGR_PEP_ID=MMETSP0270-20121206/29635_1 /TAXON_ID=71861 /ORGANISM="Scrippsiella trochoidea, Strain CCMP3099" /LENGTH=381 /DNA_ID=CAMNT_0002638869 /DNA_START=68 /DNA_END=1213 /DNA_ORIENTATION=+